MCEIIARDGMFVNELIARLNHPVGEVKMNLLQMLKLICAASPDLETLVLDHSLIQALKNIGKLAKSQKQAIVVSTCEEIIASWIVLQPQL